MILCGGLYGNVFVDIFIPVKEKMHFSFALRHNAATCEKMVLCPAANNP
jgi:hypothetical protein